MYLKIYGVIGGALCAWSGFIIGSIGVFGVARYLRASIVHHWISKRHFDSVNGWVRDRGTIGLLVVRLLPIPAILVNIVIGIMPSVSFWKYLWISGVTIVPYYVAAVSLFLGVSRRDVHLFLI